jgi:hypothetical protein
VSGADLEHGYRRWLRWYPESFRREHEAEMLGVLMAGARVGQRRPGPLDCLDLVRGGLSIRLRPRVPRSDQAVYWTVRLMHLGAAIELAVAVTLLATMNDIRSTILARDPGYTGAQWHAEVLGAIVPLLVGVILAAGFWLWMAWANGRRHRWARLLFALFFAQNTYSLLHGLARGSATYARPVLVAAAVLWCVEFAVVVLIVRTEVGRLVAVRSARKGPLPLSHT